MTPDQIAQASTALTGAIQGATATGEQQIADGAAVRAPALAVGDNAYDVGRYVTPNASAAADKLIVGAKQQMVKKALMDATISAQSKYTDANTNYQSRQRAYYRDLAIQNEQRYLEQQAMYARSVGGGGGGGGVSGSGGSIASSNGTTDIAASATPGGDGVRSRLSYLAQNGDKDAATALKYVGNDGKFYLDPNSSTYKSVAASLNKFQLTNTYRAPAPVAPVAGNNKSTPLTQKLVTGKLK